MTATKEYSGKSAMLENNPPASTEDLAPVSQISMAIRKVEKILNQ